MRRRCGGSRVSGTPFWRRSRGLFDILHSTITYGELDSLLGRLGFVPVSTSGPQKVFENPAFDALVVLPPAGADELVRPHHLVAVRKLLIEKGIIDEDAYDRLMAERLVAQA